MDNHIMGYDERSLQRHIEELVCYLWDNYLQLVDAEDLFLVGVGNAYLGIKMLLINRGKPIFPSPLLLLTTYLLPHNLIHPPHRVYFWF